MKFSKAYIIYNPKSTGDSPAIAKEFWIQLKKATSDVDIILQKTNHAGHSEELGYSLTKKYTKLLLISVSGDGGYNELVNGVIRAVNEGAENPICAVLPGGNANDHHTYILDRSLMEAIKQDGLTEIDLLKVEADKTRYAHSYVGLGLTPLIAIELNKYDLSAIKETWLALKTFWKFEPFEIEEDGKCRAYDSIIMANIGVMAKHLTLDGSNSIRDGKFEVVRWRHNKKLQLVQHLLRALIGRPSKPKSVTSLSFNTVASIPVQLDGELLKLEANQHVVVSCAPKVLRTYR